jgi:hypothetical protein
MRGLERIVATLLLCLAVTAGCQPSPKKPLPDRPSPDKPTATPLDDKVKIGVWKPNPELVGQLTQSVDVDMYQILLAKDFISAGTKTLRDNGTQYGWKRQSGEKDGAAVLTIEIIADKKIADETKDLQNALVSYWHGMFGASKIIDNAKPGEAEMGSINGITFCRFKWSGSSKIDQTQVKGLAYGAIDGDKVILVVGMNFGADAENSRQLMEATLATFKKK